MVRLGPNGNGDELDFVIELLRGRTVAKGSFSGNTGYSGWWDEYRFHGLDSWEVEVISNQTDTSHYDSYKVVQSVLNGHTLIKFLLERYMSGIGYRVGITANEDQLRRLWAKSQAAHALAVILAAGPDRRAPSEIIDEARAYAEAWRLNGALLFLQDREVRE